MKLSHEYRGTFQIRAKGIVYQVVTGLVSVTAAASIANAAPSANTLPTGGSVASGSASISSSANKMTIDQSTTKAVINWNSFSIGSASEVRFNVPTSSSSTLNRVVQNNPSEIFGKLSSNGNVLLVNPNGIIFGQGSSVNVGSLTATTMNIKDQDYLNDNYVFTRDNVTGTITNYGTLSASDKGYIALLAPTVINEGVVRARLGSVVMAAGERATLNFDSTGLVSVTLDKSTIDTLINNKQMIVAEGGKVFLSASSANNLLAAVVNSGVVDASSMSDVGGKIVLSADLVANTGSLLATGKTGGGEILVGGDAHGSNADIYGEAKYALLGANSVIDASAIDNGNGGKVVVWSNLVDGYTYANGIIKVEGGANGGNGGFIETSGHTLNVAETTNASARAPKGANGSWLLDPVDIIIYHNFPNTDSTFTSSDGTNNEGFIPRANVDFNNETYTAIADTIGNITDPTDPSRFWHSFTDTTSHIQDATINAALNSGTSVWITTYNAGESGNGDITILSGVNILNSNTGRDWRGYPIGIYLYANRNIIGNEFTISTSSQNTPLNVGMFANHAEINNISFRVYSYPWGDSAYYESTPVSRYAYVEDALAHTGYIKLVNTVIDTKGGSVFLGGQDWENYATGDASNPGVYLDTVNISTAGGGVANGGYVQILGANNSAGGIGVKIFNSQINTSDSVSNSPGGVTIRGAATQGDGINLLQAYITGLNTSFYGYTFDSGTTASDSVGIRFRDATVEATNIYMDAADGFSDRLSSFDSYTGRSTKNKAVGISFEGGLSGTELRPLNAGDGMELTIYDHSTYGISFGDSGNLGLTLGATTGPLSVYYTKRSTEATTPFGYVGSSPLTLRSNGTGTLSWVNYSMDDYDTGDSIPTILGGSTMGAVSGTWFSDNEIARWMKSSVFDKAIIGEYWSGTPLIVQNYNPTTAIANVFMHGGQITLKNTATIKKSPTSMAFVVDEDVYPYTFFNDEGATFTGTGDYNIFVLNAENVVRTALTQTDSDYYYDDKSNAFAKNSDDSNPQAGSYVLCADGSCGTLTTGGQTPSGGSSGGSSSGGSSSGGSSTSTTPTTTQHDVDTVVASLPKVPTSSNPNNTQTSSAGSTYTSAGNNSAGSGSTVAISTFKPIDANNKSSGGSNGGLAPVALTSANISGTDTSIVTVVKNDALITKDNAAQQPQGVSSFTARVANTSQATFAIPPSMIQSAGIADNSQVVQVSMKSGAPLPNWIKVDPVSMAIQLDNAPANAIANGDAEIKLTIKEPNGAIKTLTIKIADSASVKMASN